MSAAPTNHPSTPMAMMNLCQNLPYNVAHRGALLRRGDATSATKVAIAVAVALFLSNTASRAESAPPPCALTLVPGGHSIPPNAPALILDHTYSAPLSVTQFVLEPGPELTIQDDTRQSETWLLLPSEQLSPGMQYKLRVTADCETQYYPSDSIIRSATFTTLPEPVPLPTYTGTLVAEVVQTNEYPQIHLRLHPSPELAAYRYVALVEMWAGDQRFKTVPYGSLQYYDTVDGSNDPPAKPGALHM